MGLIKWYAKKRLRSTLLKQFTDNIKYINSECLEKSGSITLEFYKKTIDKCLIPKNKLNDMGIDYNSSFNAMYTTLKTRACDEEIVYYHHIEAIGNIAIKRYNENLNKKLNR